VSAIIKSELSYECGRRDKKDRIKQKNVSRDPRVSISVVDEENPYSMITIKGRVVDQTTNGADEHIDKLAKRYLNAERYPAHSSNVKRIILKIKPERIFYVPPRYTVTRVNMQM
jgi:hypothetical protein